MLIGTGTGLAATYFDAPSLKGAAATRVDQTVDFNWAAGASPITGIAGDDAFSARWIGQVEAVETGIYTFRTQSDDGVQLSITDGNGQVVAPLVNNWAAHVSTYDTATIAMVAGKKYDLTLEYFNDGGSGTMRLEWMRPGQAAYAVVPTSQLYRPSSQSGIGLPATYFDNADFTGAPVTRTDATIDQTWSAGASPVAGIAGSTYSVRWQGQIESIEGGTYEFQTYSDDGVRVYVAESNDSGNGTLVIDNWTNHSSTYNTGSFAMQANRKYKIRVEYYNDTGPARMQLAWMRPGQASFDVVPASQLYGPELLTNPSLEGTSNLASGWGQNPFGSYSYSKTTAVSNVHGGSSAQVVNVTSTGGQYIFGQNATLVAGRTYEASFWVRSDTPGGVDVDFMLRQTSPNYTVFGNQRAIVGSGWQKLAFRGGADTTVGAFVGMWFNTTGTVYVDDATFTDVTAGVNNATPQITTPVDSTFMGQHFNKSGYDQAKRTSIVQQTGLGIVRFWDTGTMWANFEPSNDSWNGSLISSMKATMQQIRNADPNVQFIMTLGIPADWAASVPAENSAYGTGTSTSPPRLLTDWEDYVQKMTTEFGSYIKYWEIWNEADVTGALRFYSGTMTQNGNFPGLVELTAAARSVLKDPARGGNSGNMVLTPNFVTPRALSSFLTAGGGDSVDIVSFHTYTSGASENWVSRYQAFRSVMDNSGQGNKPLWNTEGAVNTGADANTSQGVIARSYITQWLNGVSNYSWYTWDTNRGKLTNGDTANNPPQFTNWDSLTTNGLAWAETNKWLVGARAVSRQVDTAGNWIVQIARPDTTYSAYIVWNPTANSTFAVPGAWGSTRYRTLDGVVHNFAGGNLTVGSQPILIENMAPPAPLMSALQVNGGAAQRSMVKTVSAVFDQQVRLDANPFTVIKRGSPSTTYSYTYNNPSGDNRTFVLTLSGAGMIGGSVPDGVYDVTVAASKVHNYWQRRMVMTANAVTSFGRLFGDVDGNYVVNNYDFAAFKNTYGRTSSDPRFNPAFDYDGNGVINNLDYAAFQNAFGKSLIF